MNIDKTMEAWTPAAAGAAAPVKPFSHAFTIAFRVASENDGENVTADELRHGLAQRLRALRHGDEIIEDCGRPYSTYKAGQSESQVVAPPVPQTPLDLAVWWDSLQAPDHPAGCWAAGESSRDAFYGATPELALAAYRAATT